MNHINLGKRTFKLEESFIQNYINKKAPFGFNGLGELTYIRTYSRLKADGQNEKWYETIRRVVEGTYSIQKNHINYYGLGWSEEQAQHSAEEMYDLMFNMKFLPPGRGIWAMGTDIIEKRGLFAALNNCAFISTDNLAKDLTKPFEFLMDMSMLGVGVGFDVEGAGQIEIKQPKENVNDTVFVIEDSREGWVKSLKLILMGYFKGNSIPEIDYSLIRKKGEAIKTFGGTASGSGPLKHLHKQINKILSKSIGKTISIRNIVDIMNLIGQCVVAGGVRRTAEISFGPSTQEYLSLKNYYWNAEEGKFVGAMAERADFGWTSNNSIFAKVGQDYTEVGAQTAVNGEPGYAWLENMQKYGRMIDPPNWKDKKAKGGNPCLEQTLESGELCNLVEIFVNSISSLDEFLRVIKFAYLYAKTVTLGQTHVEETNRIMLRNRRIGTSMSGIVQKITEIGIDEFKQWCDSGYKTIQKYDEIYSDWLCIVQSIKKTSIKPSGTISLLNGSTPGIHYPEDIYCIRRIRILKTSDLIQKCIIAGYVVEPDAVDDSVMVVEIPIKFDKVDRTVSDVSIWEQVSLAAMLQAYWADNQVSCTVTFKPEEGKEIPHILNHFQYQLKGISFLPKVEKGVYAQMPYEGITEEKYNQLMKNIVQIDFSGISEESTPEKFCDNDYCVIK